MKTLHIVTTIVAFVTGFMTGVIFSHFHVSTGAFYTELRKRALTSSDFICSEAKEAKFLYDTYKIKE